MHRHPSLVVFALAFITSARAFADDCPPGSVFKNEDGFSFCEATVCANDSQCTPNICRPVRLCIQVGTLGDAASAEGGKRLVATQRCAPDMTCPQSTICSEMGRCLSKSDADKMGILTPSAASTGSAASGAAGGEKKSSCGCRVVASAPATTSGLLGITVLAAAVLRRRWIARPSSRVR